MTDQQGELTAVFCNAVVIAVDLSCGDGKKVAVVSHFSRQKFRNKNKTFPLLFVRLHFFSLI